MPTPVRHVRLMAASLAVTCVLSFALGITTTLWLLPQIVASAPASTGPALTAASEGVLRLPMAPAIRLDAAEASILLPEVFANRPAQPARTPTPDAYTLQLGIFLAAAPAEAMRARAESEGLPATTRLLVDPDGRGWYVVQAGAFSDRIAAALAARAFGGEDSQGVAVVRRADDTTRSTRG